MAGLPVVGVAPVPAACRFLPAAAAAAFVFLFVIKSLQPVRDERKL